MGARAVGHDHGEMECDCGRMCLFGGMLEYDCGRDVVILVASNSDTDSDCAPCV